MILELYFDGTSNTIDDEKARKVGQTAIATLFLKSNATNYEDLDSNHDHGDCIKIYRPGPGSGECEYKTEKKSVQLSTPGSGKLKKIKGLVTGDGWEENLHKTIAQVISLINQSKDDKVEIILSGYSRGGITAIAFSELLSEMIRQKVISNQKKVTIKALHAVDPVAGLDYGKLEQTVKRASYKDGVETVNPILVGSCTENLVLHIATTERRRQFKPQLPFGVDEGENNRPLLIPDNVKVTLRYVRACHHGIAFPEDKKAQREYAPAKITIDTINSDRKHDLQFPCILSGNIQSTYHDSFRKEEVKTLSTQFAPRDYPLGIDKKPISSVFEDRSVRDKVPENSFIVIEEYTNSVLYDCNKFMEKNGVSFITAFQDESNPYHQIARWAYHNSYFYQMTQKKPSELTPNTLEKIISIKSKHDQVNSFYKPIVIDIINDTIINLRSPLARDKEKKLIAIKDNLSSAKSKKECYDYLIKAKNIVKDSKFDYNKRYFKETEQYFKQKNHVPVPFLILEGKGVENEKLPLCSSYD